MGVLGNGLYGARPGITRLRHYNAMVMTTRYCIGMPLYRNPSDSTFDSYKTSLGIMIVSQCETPCLRDPLHDNHNTVL